MTSGDIEAPSKLSSSELQRDGEGADLQVIGPYRFAARQDAPRRQFPPVKSVDQKSGRGAELVQRAGDFLALRVPEASHITTDLPAGKSRRHASRFRRERLKTARIQLRSSSWIEGPHC